MKKKRTPRQIAVIVLFSLGLLLITLLTFVATWGDLEANFYEFDKYTQTRLGRLDCPVLMAADEKPVISVPVTNKTNYATNIAMRADFSSYGYPRREDQLVRFQPGETKVISWSFSEADAIFSNFVLAKVYMGGAYPMPPAENTCGVYVMNLRGVNGMVVYWTIFALGLGALLAAMILLERPDPDEVYQRGTYTQARRLLAVTAVIGLYMSYAGVWLVGVLAMVVMLVLLLSLLFISVSLTRQGPQGPI